MVTRNHCRLAEIIFLTALLWVFSHGDLPAGQAKPAATVSVQVGQKRLAIVRGKDRHVFDLSDLFEGYELSEGKLLFDNADGKLRYLVVFVSGPSRSPIAAQSYCAAGTEGFLLWLALDNRWRMEKRQAALIASCFQSADGDYEIKANRLAVVWDNYRLEKHFTLDYDSLAPERGFVITETNIEKSK